MTELTVPVAVFGPLATGADVRLLARPAGGELSAAALAEFSRFYYAGWRGAAEREAPYWTFLPLDDHCYWGLAKSQVIAKRSMGDVFVSWLLLLNPRQLEEIDWRTPRLWNGFLPEQLYLPEPGTHLPPVRAAVDEPSLGSREAALADNLAFSIESAWQRGQKVILPDGVGPGDSPHAALAAAIDRMGRLAANHSYTTWGGIERQDFETMLGSFDLVAGGPPSSDGARELASAETSPSMAWLDRRRREGGIEAELDADLSEDDIRQIAEDRFRAMKSRLVTQRDFSAFREIARDNDANSVAVPQVLEFVLEALRDAGHQAEAIDVFVRDALDEVKQHPSVPEARGETVFKAISRKLVFRLKPATIDALADILFGTDGRPGLSAEVTAVLKRHLETSGGFEWAVPETLEAMLAHQAAGNASSDLREMLLVALGANRNAATVSIDAYLDQAPSFAAMDRRYRRLCRMLPAFWEAVFVERMIGHWGKRALAAMRGEEGYDAGIAAILAVLEERRQRTQRFGARA